MDQETVPMGDHFDIVIHRPDTGPFTACLHHKGESTRSLANIDLWPHHDFSTGVEHVIYRPERNSDGLTSQFEQAVHRWAEDRFPMHEDRIYKRLIDDNAN